MADVLPLKILSNGLVAQFQSGDTISTTIAPGTGGSGGGTTSAIVMPYVFSTTTTDSDPGAGTLRLDNATQGSATVIRVDDVDSNAIDWQGLFLTMADPLSVNSYTGYIHLIKQTDPTKWIQFEVTATVDATGYWNLGVTVVNLSGANPFANADPLFLVYVQNGAKGDTGANGADGADGSPSSVPDVQVFVALGSNTWTKPSGSPVNVTRCLIAPGGGGGSGRCGAAGSLRAGGGGGGGGGYSADTQAASLFNGTETVFIGTRGSGGTGSVPTNNGVAGGTATNTTMTGSNGAGTLTATGGTGGGAGTNLAAGAGGAGGNGTIQTGAAGANGGVGNAGAGSLAPDGSAITTGLRNAGGGGGGGAGISATNFNDTTGGWGGASAGAQTSRTVGLLAAGVAATVSHNSAEHGNNGPGYPASTGPVNYGGSGGAGGANALSYVTTFATQCRGGRGGQFGGGGGGGAGYTNSTTQSNDGFPGGDSIAIVITTF